MSTFDALKLQSHGQVVPQEMERFYRHRQTLTQIFNTIDKDRSGFISKEEFITACKVTINVTLHIVYVETEKRIYHGRA